MHTLLLFAVLHGVVTIPPIRVFQPYPDVKCPRGYSIWWPAGKEFENDRYAECTKPIATTSRTPRKITSNVSLRKKTTGH